VKVSLWSCVVWRSDVCFM